jgi:DNA-binding transcriptional regulator YiaG
MANHPNRSRRGSAAPGQSPSSTEVSTLRADLQMTQAQAAALIYGSVRTWQDYEAGARSMHPSTWALIKLRVHHWSLPDL